MLKNYKFCIFFLLIYVVLLLLWFLFYFFWCCFCLWMKFILFKFLILDWLLVVSYVCCLGVWFEDLLKFCLFFGYWNLWKVDMCDFVNFIGVGFDVGFVLRVGVYVESWMKRIVCWYVGLVFYVILVLYSFVIFVRLGMYFYGICLLFFKNFIFFSLCIFCFIKCINIIFRKIGENLIL